MEKEEAVQYVREFEDRARIVTGLERVKLRKPVPKLPFASRVKQVQEEDEKLKGQGETAGKIE